MRRLIALGVAGVVLLVLVVAQLVLPGIAASRLRDQLSRSGDVLAVKVSAFPAIELLWGQADKVVVRMGRYQAGASEIGGRLDAAGDVGSLDASAQEVNSGALTLRNARLRKQGDELIGTAVVRQADLRSAVPFLDNVQPVASADGAADVARNREPARAHDERRRGGGGAERQPRRGAERPVRGDRHDHAVQQPARPGAVGQRASRARAGFRSRPRRRSSKRWGPGARGGAAAARGVISAHSTIRPGRVCGSTPYGVPNRTLGARAAPSVRLVR